MISTVFRVCVWYYHVLKTRYHRVHVTAVIPECCAWAANCGCLGGGRAGRGQRPVLAGEGPM
eukprot:1674972-Prymnesium_polylepis.1